MAASSWVRTELYTYEHLNNSDRLPGDKSNHVPTLHIPQLFYFFAFAGAFLTPVLVSPRAVRDALGGLTGSVKCALPSQLFWQKLMASPRAGA